MTATSDYLNRPIRTIAEAERALLNKLNWGAIATAYRQDGRQGAVRELRLQGYEITKVTT